ncbi:diamine acetyltransferase 2 [Strongylocentrotus purpuratus]|uniref:N-acetyltransferase domain-containing protein n=1 Tax=Strongylocentrotus purpuratus TaxID=7668 RepID=A0A7M7NLU2_STRPU|nr:diamine acetyltransferase 2 [Strongylocentrotus purpuratus]|eukprot:XP_011660666.1 PREDICTED: diamine acetyltransferase 2 [Strongylocentrotus purpuratus]
MESYIFREATKLDVETIYQILVEDICQEDDTWDQVMISKIEFKELCFGSDRSLYPIVVEYATVGGTNAIDKAIVGCVMFTVITDYLHGKQIYIQGLAVKHEHRKKAVGTKLVETAMEFGQKLGCKSAFVLIERANSASMNVFKKFNGEVIWENYSMVHCKNIGNIM